MEIEFYQGNNDYIAKFDLLTLEHLLLQTSASLIVGCRTYPVKEETLPTSSDIGVTLMKYTTWAYNGYTNALLAQADFIKSFIYHCIRTTTKPYLMDYKSACLLADSLEHFQAYKTEICKDEQVKHGEHWGTATGFFKANWTEYNQEFLSLWNSHK